MTRAREIGSEFWQAEGGAAYAAQGSDYLSGRTALAAVALDLKQQGLCRICLPDYCCESMIEPFLREKMEIGFYSVSADGSGLTAALEETAGFEAVLLVDYFGLMGMRMEEAARRCSKDGQKVLLDLTHGVFDATYQHTGDYIFGSYRKWTGVEAGFAVKQNTETGLLPTWPLNDTGRRYLSIRRQAREAKAAFVAGGYKNELLRQTQLSAFAEAEDLLDGMYLSDTDEENRARLATLDIGLIQKHRRENAAIIYQGLAQLKSCSALFSTMPEGAVPLTIPVLVQEGRRDDLRNFLREHGIFCPVHWPLSRLHSAGPSALELYKNELSLVCDQRYDALDMVRMMETVKQWERIEFA